MRCCRVHGSHRAVLQPLPSLTVLWTVEGKCPPNQAIPCSLWKVWCQVEPTDLASTWPSWP